MKRVYIVVEGQTDAAALRRILPTSIKEQCDFVIGNGKSAAISDARTILILSREPVALVVDAAHGILAESTAELPTDMPGVRVVEWSKFASGYAHVGVVRLKGKTANDLPRVVSWVSERKGKPYRWPIIQGLDKLDQSRFYCSQLVWLAFKNVLNLDLDADKGLIVFPDDIYYSKEFVDVIVP